MPYLGEAVLYKFDGKKDVGGTLPKLDGVLVPGILIAERKNDKGEYVYDLFVMFDPDKGVQAVPCNVVRGKTMHYGKDQPVGKFRCAFDLAFESELPPVEELREIAKEDGLELIEGTPNLPQERRKKKNAKVVSTGPAATEQSVANAEGHPEKS